MTRKKATETAANAVPTVKRQTGTRRGRAIAREPVRHNGLLCWQSEDGRTHTPLSAGELAEYQNTH